jgi:hypothetical protein
MKLHQISVFLENTPGQLKQACDRLAEAGLNMLTLSLADTKSFGILHIIVQDWQRARDILKEAGFAVNVVEVLAVEVPDRPGGLAAILGPAEAAGLNVEYMYAFAFGRGDKAVMILRFSDIEAAITALKKAGISLVESVELYGHKALGAEH